MEVAETNILRLFLGVTRMERNRSKCIRQTTHDILVKVREERLRCGVYMYRGTINISIG